MLATVSAPHDVTSLGGITDSQSCPPLAFPTRRGSQRGVERRSLVGLARTMVSFLDVRIHLSLSCFQPFLISFASRFITISPNNTDRYAHNARGRASGASVVQFQLVIHNHRILLVRRWGVV